MSTPAAFDDHGDVPGDRISGTGEQARETFDDLAAAGVDMADVFAVLEREGVEKFVASWTELGETVDGQLSKTAKGAKVTKGGGA